MTWTNSFPPGPLAVPRDQSTVAASVHATASSPIRSPIRENCGNTSLLAFLRTAGVAVDPARVRAPAVPAGAVGAAPPPLEFDVSGDAHTTVMMNYVAALRMAMEHDHPSLPRFAHTWAADRRCYIAMEPLPGYRPLRAVAALMTPERLCLTMHALCETVAYYMLAFGVTHEALSEDTVWVAPGLDRVVVCGFFSEPDKPPPRTSRSDVRALFRLGATLLPHTDECRAALAHIHGSRLRAAGAALLDAVARVARVARRRLSASLAEYIATFIHTHRPVYITVDPAAPDFRDTLARHALLCVAHARDTGEPVFPLFRDPASPAEGLAPCRAILRAYLGGGSAPLPPPETSSGEVYLGGGGRGAPPPPPAAYAYLFGLSLCLGGYSQRLPARWCFYLMFGLDHDDEDEPLDVAPEGLAMIEARRDEIRAMRAGFAPFAAWFRRGGFTAQGIYEEISRFAAAPVREKFAHAAEFQDMTPVEELRVARVLESLDASVLSKLATLITETNDIAFDTRIIFAKQPLPPDGGNDVGVAFRDAAKVPIHVCTDTLPVPEAALVSEASLLEFVQILIATVDDKFDCF